ncbi:MAG: hypothetical protein Fur0041_04590 [Bacteroidia bacterium]
MAQGRLAPPDPNAVTLFEWPMQLRTGLNDYGYHSVSGHVDQNPSFPNQLLDYNCGQRTYDTPSGYNHKGTDYYLWPFSWNKMDSSDVEIIAAAPGTIIYKSDGNFDRSCTSNSNNWNAVYVQHADGSVAWYGHMKNGSLTSKTIGQTVALGEYLGVVGSSGNSTGPHLHMEVYDASNNLIEPYAGNCNNMNTAGWWQNQRPYYDAAVNHIATNHHLPVFTPCSNQTIKNEQDYFGQLDTIYLMSYYRFLNTGDTIYVNIYRPNNSLWGNWSWVNTMPNYTSAYVYWWMIAGNNAPFGQWTFEVIYKNQSYIHHFNIGMTGNTEQNDESFRIFPNPAQNKISISGNNLNGQQATLEIFAANGMKVDSYLFASSSQTFALNLNTGLYIYVIRGNENGRILGKGKLLVE